MTRETEIAWAAGFFDGEGTVWGGLKRGRQRVPYLALGQIDVRPLARFQLAVGCGRIYGPYAEKRPPAHPIFRFVATSRADIEQVCSLLWSYLSEPKREQIWRAVSAYDGWGADARRRGRPPQRHVPEALEQPSEMESRLQENAPNLGERLRPYLEEPPRSG